MISKLFIFTSIIITIFIYSYSWGSQTLELDRELSTEGYVTISWQEAHLSVPVVVQLATDDSFNQLLKEIKLTNQNAIHLTGLQNGKYFVRLLTNNNVMSETSTFTVKHRDLTTAINFFIFGAILFIFLIVTLLKFNSRY